ncbi:hypothetical protein NPIL_235411 [Nephila pilipes]|uniref:Uncharacterized protein n=1 Tax=Nephila pilipes TaxID=299642 RepID=A0A8X6TTA9_NEPPI|nr:hypothetical protein NPIL_235411 [Nephila pilipes]
MERRDTLASTTSVSSHNISESVNGMTTKMKVIGNATQEEKERGEKLSLPDVHQSKMNKMIIKEEKRRKYLFGVEDIESVSYLTKSVRCYGKK